MKRERQAFVPGVKPNAIFILLKSGHVYAYVPLQEAVCSCRGLPGTRETHNHILVGHSEPGGPPELI